MNQNNPLWSFFPELVRYVNRCQWMLRQGRPAKQLAVYLPVEDCFARGGVDQMALDFPLRDAFVTGKPTSEFGLANALRHHSNLLHNLVTHGFDYDGIDFWAMDRIAKVSRGRLDVGDDSFRFLVLPNLEGMELEAARKVEAFCRSGGIVIATRRLPVRVYGVEARKGSRELRAIMQRMFG